ncbi:MAG: hypothetical protein ACOX0M_01070 [Salinivirgaceae bacterium]|jgi:uncharacterized membrane protein|nr:hypothetical protein [Bacteroidales bacterium]
MKNLKTGITLIILGNVLYVSKDFFDNVTSSNFSDFTQGFLVGLGIGLNVIGIILVFVYLAKEEKKKNNN